MSLLKRSEMNRFKKGLLALAALAILAVPLVVAAYLSPEVTITSAAVQPEAQPDGSRESGKRAGESGVVRSWRQSWSLSKCVNSVRT